MKLFINTDGGGGTTAERKAAAAFVARLEDGTFVAAQNRILEGTSNVAEWQGVVLAMHALPTILDKYPDVDALQFNLDSQLVSNQLMGKFECKDARLNELRETAWELRRRIPMPMKVHWDHRETNKEADFLCHEALNGRIIADIFAPMPTKPSAKGKVTAGQLFRIGLLDEPKPLRVDKEGFALCNGCKAKLLACKCPLLEVEIAAAVQVAA